MVVDKLHTKLTGYSSLENSCAYFVSEVALNKHAKTITHPKLRGKDHRLFHKKGSLALAALALQLSDKLGKEPIVAVFFRDCDGTQTSPSSRYDMIYDSINGEKGGFRLAGLCSGVPMLPRPKSEAWLLCAFKDQPFQYCHVLESLSGNDNSPRSAKKLLQARLAALGGDACSLHCHNCASCAIDFSQIKMPSFNKFAKDLEKALTHNARSWREPILPSIARTLGL